MPTNYDDLYATESNYLKAKDFPQGQKAKLRISGHKLETFDDGAPKAALTFEGKDKGVVLNGTNYERIKQVYGSDVDMWVGRDVFLSTEVIPRGKFEGQFMFRVEAVMEEVMDDDILF